MFKMKCPVCKHKMGNVASVYEYKVYECSNCKSLLKVSISYRIGFIVAIFLGSFIGVSITDKLIQKNTNIQRFVICPLIVGISVGITSLLFVLLYPNKLTKNE